MAGEKRYVMGEREAFEYHYQKVLVKEDSQADLTLVTCIPCATAVLHMAEPKDERVRTEEFVR